MKKPITFREAKHREGKRHRLLKAIDDAAGLWKSADHPELRHGNHRFVQRLRRESDRRVKRS
jgi:hypothetical protein